LNLVLVMVMLESSRGSGICLKALYAVSATPTRLGIVAGIPRVGVCFGDFGRRSTQKWRHANGGEVIAPMTLGSSSQSTGGRHANVNERPSWPIATYPSFSMPIPPATSSHHANQAAIVCTDWRDGSPGHRSPWFRAFRDHAMSFNVSIKRPACSP
jgi:hypothetical protein